MGDSVSELLVRIICPLTVALVLYLWKRLVDQLRKPQLTKRIVPHGALLVLIIVGLAPLCWTLYSSAKGIPVCHAQFWLSGSTLLMQLVTVALLYCWIRQNSEQHIQQAIRTKDQQYDEFLRAQAHVMRAPAKATREQYDQTPILVRIGPNKKSARTIPVRRLHIRGFKPGQRLYLSPRTFSDGIHFLKEQIDSCAPAIEPHLCVGINSIGGVIASFFSRNLGTGKIPLGFVRTEGQDHRLTEPLLPACKAVRTILVADIEVKRGQSLANLSRFLHKKYGHHTEIKVVVLVAAGVTATIERIEELRKDYKGVFEAEPCHLPDFLAFTSRNKVRVYGNIR